MASEETAQSPSGPRIFCFAVVAPGTYEPEMVEMQYQQGSGIFGCDNYTVVSNVSAAVLFKDPLATGRIHVSVVDANLWVKLVRGPQGWDPSSPGAIPAKHLLNAPVFVKVWDKLFSNGDYEHYDWTLKLDVDAFVVPTRLRTLLSFYTQQPSRSLYLLNAPADMYGNFLHGPIEALSKAAMEVYKNGAERCKKEVTYADKGEDWYLGLCLQLLGVQGIKELRLLSDAYMWGSHHVNCDTPFATFHPLKSVEEWDRCLEQVCPTAANPWTSEVMFKYNSRPLVSTTTGGYAALAVPGACLAMMAVLGGISFTVRLLQKRRQRLASLATDCGGESVLADREPCLVALDPEEEC